MSRFNTGNPIGSADPRDRDDNSKNLDEAINSDSDRFTDRLGKLRPTLRGAIDPTGLASSAATSAQQAGNQADRAEAARDAATVNAGIYDTIAAGIAATSSGGQFQVLDGLEIVRYRNDSGSAVELARFPSAANPVLIAGKSISGELRFPVFDDDGVIAAGYDSDGRYVAGEAVFNKLDISSSSVRHIESTEFSILFHDADGAVGAAVSLDGQFVSQNAGGGGAHPHMVTVAFVEPWLDPSDDMAITWVSDSPDATLMEYRVRGASSWLPAVAHRSRPFPAISGLYIHTAIADDLFPATVYECHFPGSNYIDRFRTCPRKDVTVIAASDYQGDDYSASSKLVSFGGIASSENPDLVLMPGDHVFDNGRFEAEYSQRWLGYLGVITRDWRHGDAMVPLIMLVGNHDGRNSNDTSAGADRGGNNDIGQMADIFTWSYDPEHPTRHCNSAAVLTVGSELALITLETDHTEPLPGDQTTWFGEQLAALHADHRHLLVSGHAPPWYLAEGGSRHFAETQARHLRNVMWPMMAPYANKIRCYMAGHAHVLTITEKLQTDYDPNLTPVANAPEENDRRWYVDEDEGVRMIGCGPIGSSFRPIDPRAFETSLIDSSQLLLAGSGLDGSGSPEAYGPVSNIGDEGHHLWSLRFNSSEFSARAIGIQGLTQYEINENIGD